ncbi:Uncharacterised protein [Candidatus Gugararchaeum adminiculabundum]|nr:Uncharacterised protein [Candidatus Gugararchaeum adminiculabundum]
MKKKPGLGKLKPSLSPGAASKEMLLLGIAASNARYDYASCLEKASKSQPGTKNRAEWIKLAVESGKKAVSSLNKMSDLADKLTRG